MGFVLVLGIALLYTGISLADTMVMTTSVQSANWPCCDWRAPRR
ncbi:hypothetical protein [Streptomyces sp. NPDC002573]